jgi:putative endonuclease
VVKRREVLAFVEVKARSGLGYGSPAEGVTAAKSVRLRLLAGRFLASHPGLSSPVVRFDVAEVFLARDGSLTVDVIEDAF